MINNFGYMNKLSVCLLVLVLLLSGAAKGLAEENKPYVARAQFTTAMEEREPVDNVVILSSENQKIYFFTDLRNLSGQQVRHRWEYNGNVEAEVEFQVEGDRWRTYSSKTMDPNKLGEWTVLVIDQEGWPLKAVVFEYATGPTKLFEQ